MALYVVADATQVNHRGRLYLAGEAVPLTDEEAAPLVASRTVHVVAEPSPRAAALAKAKAPAKARGRRC